MVSNWVQGCWLQGLWYREGLVRIRIWGLCIGFGLIIVGLDLQFRSKAHDFCFPLNLNLQVGSCDGNRPQVKSSGRTGWRVKGPTESLSISRKLYEDFQNEVTIWESHHLGLAAEIPHRTELLPHTPHPDHPYSLPVRLHPYTQTQPHYTIALRIHPHASTAPTQ